MQKILIACAAQLAQFWRGTMLFAEARLLLPFVLYAEPSHTPVTPAARLTARVKYPNLQGPLLSRFQVIPPPFSNHTPEVNIHVPSIGSSFECCVRCSVEPFCRLKRNSSPGDLPNPSWAPGRLPKSSERMRIITGVRRSTLSLCPECNREAADAVVRGDASIADFRNRPGIINAEILSAHDEGVYADQ